MSTEKGWIGVDLDGTLARYDGWKGPEHIGEPIAPMLKRVQSWLAAGNQVRCFTARASIPEQIPPVRAWLDKHGLEAVAVTCTKDFSMVALWDDRAVGVITNLGVPSDTPVAMALKQVIDASGIPVEHGMEYAAAARIASSKIVKAIAIDDVVRSSIDGALDALRYVRVDNPDLARAVRALEKAQKALS